MTKILDRLPVLEQRSVATFGDRHVTVLRNQILVWVSVHLAGMLYPESSTPVVPALLDTGNNFDFTVQHRHLRDWASIDPNLLAQLGNAEINGQVVNRQEATVCLHPNLPGQRELASGKRPFRLHMESGIAVYPDNAIPPGPRLPLLGMPAFINNDLDLWLDPEMRHISVQTRTWRRRIMRLLCRI
jgi:hypothetical protein